MKSKLTYIILIVLVIIGYTKANAQKMEVPPTIDKLAEKFVAKDSSLFNAIFNTCDTKEIENILSNDFVFLNDNGGQTSAQSLDDFIESIKKNFCDKQPKPRMRRELVKESVKVFTTNKEKATQTGTQRFYVVNEGKDQLVEESRFSREWQLQNGDWKMKKELDYQLPLQKEAASNERFVPDPYIPVDKVLYDTIVRMDSLYFDTYNTCDVNKMSRLMADTFEFYHDKGGLETSKPNFIQSIKNNICGKVSRVLVPNSIEVYPINGFGAVEIGYHRFVNHAEGNSVSKPDKFIVIWQKKAEGWVMTRIVSLH